MQLAKPAFISWQDAIDLWKSENVNLTSSTLEFYRKVIIRLSQFCGSEPCRVTKFDLLRFLGDFKDAATYNIYLCALRSFFRWLSSNVKCPDASEGLKTKKEESFKTQRCLSESEYRLIFNHKGKARDLAVFLCNTGLRVSEMCGICPDHVDIQSREVRVIGKGRKVRVVPLNETAFEIITRYNLQLSKNRVTVNSNFLKLAKRLQIQHFNPHACRHFFCTQLVRAGANLADISRLAGHSSVNITIKFYYHSKELHNVVGLLISDPPPGESQT